MSKALRDPSTQLTFIKQENSIHLLVGLLTGSDARCRLLALQCLHELSHSPHTSVSLTCLPASSYLLTYLSGQSTRFTELCLYTLGNLCPDGDAVTEKLLAQGIIPALANCMESQRHNLAVVEAAAFTLSQLLQTRTAAQNIIPTVLASRLPSLLLSVLTPEPEFGPAPAIECAWCLHYLTSSTKDNRELLTGGALQQCSSLLGTLGGAVTAGKRDEGLELLLCPLLRCVGNLLCCCPVEELSSQVGGASFMVTLCAIIHTYLHTRPSLAREAAWVLNNATAHCSQICSALLSLNLVPALINLLLFSEGINVMILRTLANVAHKNKESSVQLVEHGLLAALCTTLKMADQEMVTLSLEVLFLLVDGSSKIAKEFVRQGGLALLEVIQFNSEREMRERASYLLHQHFVSYDQ
ncbi:transmembrane and coiled-coil domain-containing protein 6 isoform X2 [Gouania willdenowi]|nr:transmembrane and coiled-coil domain-containing protein 6 isoform X2 [Gouania willdenowi]